MTVRKATRNSMVELNWKPLLGRFDNNRLRKGKALAKQGMVSNVSFQQGQTIAQVKNGIGQGVYHVHIPSVSWWFPYEEQVAKWFSYRPDWLASMMIGVWPDDFLEFVASTGLRLFPDEVAADKIESAWNCTCLDLETPCKHILATVYKLISEMERDPLFGLEQMGVRVPSLLDQVHAYGAKQVSKGTDESCDSPFQSNVSQSRNSLTVWPEEKTTWFKEGTKQVQRWQRLSPELDAEKVFLAQEIYKTWT